MRCFLLILFSIIFVLKAHSQARIADVDSAYKVIDLNFNNPDSIQYVLYIHSSHNCGYCRMLRRDFNNENIPKNLRVIFMEYDTPEEAIIKDSNTYVNSEVVIVKMPARNSQIRLFPTSELVKVSDDKVIRTIKGYRSNYWTKIFRIIE